MAGYNARRSSRGLRPRDPNLPCLHTRSGRGPPPCKQRCFTQGSAPTVQTLDLRAARGKAFTIFFAGLAFTMTTLPKISRFPAFVAGFMRVLILHKPGREKAPLLTTSFVALSQRLPRIFMHAAFFSSHDSASASAMAPLEMDFFVAAFMLGAIAMAGFAWRCGQGWRGSRLEP